MSEPDGSHSSRLLRSPLLLLVGAVAAAGTLAALAAVRFSDDRPIIGSTYPQWQLAAGLLILACVAEAAYVRLRHGESTEDLTFFEAVVVAAVLLLPVAQALGVALGGLVLSSLVMRRPLVKVVFNLGSYAAGAALLALLAHAASGSSSTLDARTVLGLVAGTVGFAAVNLLALAVVLSVVEGSRVGETLAAEWQLSVVMALGNAGAGMLAVEIARSAPALLPFVALPVLTLAHSYRSAVRHAEELRRNRWLVTLGAVLAEQPDGGVLLPATETVRGLFAAHEARILVAPGSGVIADQDGTRLEAMNPALTSLLETFSERGDARIVSRALLPVGSRRGLGVALDLGPHTRGALVLGWTDRRSRSWERMWRSGQPLEADQSMLVAVAAAVSNAIRAAEHLQALTEESSKLQAVVDHGTDGIAVLTPQGELLVWSPAMTRLTGIDLMADGAVLGAEGADGSQEEPVVALLTRVGGADTKQADIARALPHGYARAKVMITVRGEDEDRRQLEISVAHIADESHAGELTVLTARDVTEAGRLERLKADFIASVSHELRTPITPIKAYAQLLAKRGQNMEPARRLHALQLIEDRADHLSRLVDDLLLASRVGAVETSQISIELGEVDLRTIVDKSMTSSPLLVGRATATLAGHPVIVSCDTVRAVQCLSNLLSNAVKYSPADSPIQIEITETASHAYVSVTDRGRGIPAAEIERVFERFHRVENAFTMTTSGSGLGLYIARELARAMGGDITLISKLGYGSTLALSLPRPQAADRAEPSAPVAERLPEEARL
jgi:signal transduction histidine kinase